jgi:NAD(P)-dependent dehydrogenase (short-subunit alcohol dehydrogenase family)
MQKHADEPRERPHPSVRASAGPPASSALAAFDLRGKVVLITGASSGLGTRFARVAHAAGASTSVTARRIDRLELLRMELPGLQVIGCDLSNRSELERPVAITIEAFGRVDVLVNCAGSTYATPAVEEPVERFADLIALNLIAPFALATAAARDMIGRGGGCIINVASIYGLIGVGRIPQAAYVTSKHGLIGLTRELAAQWGRHGIRVNAIAPGWFDSELTSEMLASASGRRFVEAGNPMGRAGEPDELDGALLYLAGDASTYVTGAVLCVDGGWTAT